MLFAADRRVHREIVEDIGSNDFLTTLAGEGEETPDGAVDGESERFQEQVEWATRGGAWECTGRGIETELRSSFDASDWGRSGGGGVTPPIRAETLALVGELLPELESVSSVIERWV